MLETAYLSCPDGNGNQPAYPWQVKKWITYNAWIDNQYSFTDLPETESRIQNNLLIALPWRTADGKVTIIK